ncbi:MAG TPA: hypothetical protein VGM56_27610 [Byssovorax sp.]
MNVARERAVAGYCGIAFSVLSLVVIPLAQPLPPPLGTSGAGFAAYFTAHRSAFLLGNYLGVLAFAPGLVQLASLAAEVRRAEKEGGFFTLLVLASGLFAYVFLACSLVVFQALPFLGAPELAPATEAMGSFAMVWFSLDGLGALPILVAVGWAALATGALPRWFARASFVTAVLAVLMSLGAMSATPAWLGAGGPLTGLGFVAFFAWTGALAVAQLRAARRA